MTRLVFAIICTLALFVAGYLVIQAVGDVLNGQADKELERQYALAEQERARAEVVAARTAQAREEHEHDRAMFQMWTITLAAFLSGGQGLTTILAAVLGAVGAWLVIRWLSTREIV